MAEKTDIPSSGGGGGGDKSGKGLTTAKVVAGLFLVVGIVLFLFLRHKYANKSTAASAAFPTPPHITHAKALDRSDNPAYRDTIDAMNKEKAQKAGTFFPVLGGNHDKLTPVAPLTPPPVNNSLAKERAAEEKLEMAAMAQEFNGSVLPIWKSHPRPQLVVLTRETPKDQNGGPGGKTKTGKGTNAGKTATSKKTRSLIPPGTILYGVLTNGLNSDNPGPVRAEITGGKFDGSVLLGHFTRNGTYMAVQFDKIIYTDKTEDSIQAFAVRPDQEMSNDIATSVNNHTIYRYGMLLASGFLTGFGQSAMYGGSQTSMSPYGTPYQMFAPSNTTTDAIYGVGTMAQQMQSVAASQFNTPPTVRAKHGTRIGILFVGGSGSKIPASGSAPSQIPRVGSTAPGAQQAGYAPQGMQPGYGLGPAPMTGYTGAPMIPGPGIPGGGMPMMPMMP